MHYECSECEYSITVAAPQDELNKVCPMCGHDNEAKES